MANTAILSQANPIRFIDTTRTNKSFYGDFAVNQVLDYQDRRCYFQKWQHDNTLRLQFSSDFVPGYLEIHDIYTNELITSVPWIEKTTSIVGQTFKVYEIEYAFVDLPTGKYYLLFSYNDQDNIPRPQQSEGIDVRDEQPNTINIRYKHTRNKLDIVFDTGIEFEFRVEGAIKNFLPDNTRDTFEDQDQELTLLDATPFLAAKFWIGYMSGVPRWVVAKTNIIQSCNQTFYDDIPYQIPKGAKYELEENDLGDDFVGGPIDIRPTENKFNIFETNPISPDDPENIFTPMQKRLRRFNVGADFNISGIFDEWSLLEKLLVVKRSGPIITMTLGTTPGGSEISQGSYLIDSSRFVQIIEWDFSGSSTLYFSGLSGADCDIIIIYKQLDVDDIDLGDLTPPDPSPTAGLAVGMCVIYGGTDEQLAVDFDSVTLLGKENTDYYGFSIVDGSGANGTMIGVDGAALAVHKSGDATFGTRNVAISSNEFKLVKNQIPDLGVYGPQNNLWLYGRRPSFPGGGTPNVYWPTDMQLAGTDIAGQQNVSRIQKTVPITLIQRIF